MSKLRNTINVLTISDAYTLAMLMIYSLLCLVFWTQLEAPFLNLISFVIVSIAVVSFAIVSSKYKGGNIFKLARRLYIMPIVFFIYGSIQLFVPIVNPTDYDSILILWDKAIFGVNPTEWIGQFSNPILTEYLQFAYMTFYLIPILIAVEFTFKGKDDKFFTFARIIMFGFFLSYLLYLFMPAIGPRFTIHEFGSINTELPGIFLTDFFRDLVNLGGGVSAGTPNPADVVNRDCMPSGHTMMTLISIYCAFKLKSNYKWLILVIGASLIFSTVYLRYHYVVDVMAGIFFALITLWIEPKIEKYLRKKGFYKFS